MIRYLRQSGQSGASFTSSANRDGPMFAVLAPAHRTSLINPSGSFGTSASFAPDRCVPITDIMQALAWYSGRQVA